MEMIGCHSFVCTRQLGLQNKPAGFFRSHQTSTATSITIATTTVTTSTEWSYYRYTPTTRGAALPQTPLLALIRRESNALGFVVTVVINSGSTSGSSNSCGNRRRGRRCRMRDLINRMHNWQVLYRQNAQLTGANNCSGSSSCGSSGRMR